VANGLPPDLLPELGRYQAIESALVRKLDGGRLHPRRAEAVGPAGRGARPVAQAAADSTVLGPVPWVHRVLQMHAAVLRMHAAAQQAGEPREPSWVLARR
jgi:hypothetical protein